MDKYNQNIYEIIHSIADWLPNDYQVTNGNSLKLDLKFDSLAIVHLQVAIEDEFQFRFDPINTDFLKVFDTVGSLLNYVMTLPPQK